MERYITNTLCLFLAYMLFFLAVFIIQGNMEFLGYIVFVLFFTFFLIYSYRRGIHYGKMSTFGLAIWGFLHMLGGTEVPGSGDIFYNLIFIDLVGEPYFILKYDQLVHLFGFAVAAFAMFDIIKSSSINFTGKYSIVFIIVVSSMGLGALNEMIEFILTLILSETNVGGYENTSLDLLFNTVGALIAGLYLLFTAFREKPKEE